MKKTRILPWLLACALTLAACGGRNAAPAASSAASPDVSSGQPAVQGAMEPIPAGMDASVPDSSAPDRSEPAPDVSQPDDSSDAQDPDDSQTVTPPPAVVSKPQTASKSQTKPETPADTSEDICGLPLAPSDGDSSVETPAESKPAPTKADAQAYIGKSVSSLIAAIGSPKGTDYAPSCLGDGEDGELFYDGFTVYTYRANGTETVQDVM